MITWHFAFLVEGNGCCLYMYWLYPFVILGHIRSVNFNWILVSFFGKFTKYEQIIKNNLKVLNLNDEKSSRLTKENLKETGKVFFEFLHK